MSAITQAFYTRLSQDFELTDQLSVFAGRPAIFTQDDVPGGAVYPYIVTAGEITNIPWYTKDSYGSDVRRDIRCYDDAQQGSKRIEDIADRIAWLFRPETPLPFPVGSGLAAIVSEARGPMIAPSDPTSHGRIVTVRLLLTEDATV